MDESVIADEDLSLERKSLLPGEGFFVPDDVRAQRAVEEVKSAAADAEAVVVTDTDADGLACAALIRERHPDAALVPSGPHHLADDLERVAEYAAEGVAVYVCDLCPDEFGDIADALGVLAERAGTLRWFDHHQWDPAVEEAVREAGFDLVVGDSEEECTADVALRSLDVSFPERLGELAAVTRDHDLWIKEDPRSDDLADYARWADDEETYIAAVREHGPDLPAEAQELLAARRVEKEELIERAIDRAEYHEVGGYTVGVTYGRCSQNEVAEAMRGAGAAASVVVKPAGSASFRGTEEFERCHEVAELVNGGGHPRAAGCKPDIYDDMLDYAHHWTTQGAVAKRVLLDAFSTVVE
jgi:oligoribonuclease NrnB/cAMP/cGMP phosphodiesterase (DHH superfamily)